MVQCLFCCNSLTWIISQHFFQQINQVRSVFWHFESHVEILFFKIIKAIQNRDLVWNSIVEVTFIRFQHFSQPCCNCKKLITFRFSLENGCQGVQFGQNAPSRPNINCCWVFGQAQNQFWSPVVSGNNVWCVFSFRVYDLATSKITDFHFPFLWK